MTARPWKLARLFSISRTQAKPAGTKCLQLSPDILHSPTSSSGGIVLQDASRGSIVPLCVGDNFVVYCRRRSRRAAKASFHGWILWYVPSPTWLVSYTPKSRISLHRAPSIPSITTSRTVNSQWPIRPESLDDGSCCCLSALPMKAIAA